MISAALVYSLQCWADQILFKVVNCYDTQHRPSMCLILIDDQQTNTLKRNNGRHQLPVPQREHLNEQLEVLCLSLLLSAAVTSPARRSGWAKLGWVHHQAPCSLAALGMLMAITGNVMVYCIASLYVYIFSMLTGQC